MDISKLLFWKKSKRSSRRSSSSRQVEPGYFGGSIPVRVPQITVVDMIWLGDLFVGLECVHDHQSV